MRFEVLHDPLYTVCQGLRRDVLAMPLKGTDRVIFCLRRRLVRYDGMYRGISWDEMCS